MKWSRNYLLPKLGLWYHIAIKGFSWSQWTHITSARPDSWSSLISLELLPRTGSGGLTQASSQAPTHLLALPSPLWWGEHRRKVRRLMDQDKGSLVGEAKTAHVSRVIKRNLFSLSLQQQMSCTSWKAKPQHTLRFLRKTNGITTSVSLSSSFPWAFTAACDIERYEITLWSTWISCPSCAPTQLLADLQPAHWWGRVGKREKLSMVQVLLSKAKTLVCYERCSSHKSKTQHWTVCKGENQLLPNRAQYRDADGSFSIQVSISSWPVLWAHVINQGVSSGLGGRWRPASPPATAPREHGSL